MSFKFALIPLAASAIFASPLAASADTLTPTDSNYHYRSVESDRSNPQRFVPNYIGVGGSNRGAALESKFAFNDRFSIRPMAIDNLKSEGQQGNFSIPVTYDFQPLMGIQPYFGGGLGITAGDNSDLGGMFTAGIDYPMNKSLTANANVSYDVFGNNEVNGVLGVAANFN